jgi:hypothetical protein
MAPLLRSYGVTGHRSDHCHHYRVGCKHQDRRDHASMKAFVVFRQYIAC